MYKDNCIVKTPIGSLALYAEQDAIVHTVFTDSEAVQPQSEFLKDVAKQLGEYFNGRQKEFDLSLNPRGTAFQMKVWECLRGIPYGETITYGQLAALIGKPGAARAVGNANGANPIPILIPCHRVTAGGGGLGGFSCGIWRKEFLLALEEIR